MGMRTGTRIVVVAGIALLVGCTEPEEGPAERAGKRIDESMEKANEKAREGMERAGEEMQKLGERMQDAGD
jgi:hypothetical protein